LAAAKSVRHKEIPEVTYVPIQYSEAFFEQLATIAGVLPPEPPVYLVGGAVRDALLGKATHDLDFTLAGDVFQVSRRVADKLGAAFFPLDEDRKIARLVLNTPDGRRTTYDFSALRGANLEEDLRDRDFTINAMALDVRQPDALLDPLSGAADLRQKYLRACSPAAISDDPVRVLRGIRLAAAYNLHILPETRGYLRAAVPLLSRISPERVRDELFRIFAGPQPAACLRALDMLGVFAGLMPEVLKLKGVRQSDPHISDVWQHTLDVVQKLEVLTSALRPNTNPDEAANLMVGLAVMKLAKYRGRIAELLDQPLNPDRTTRALLFFSAFYHDIGKPGTVQQDEAGAVHFLGHENTGELIAADRAQALRLSNGEVNRVRAVIRGHLRPLSLARLAEPPTRRAIFRFFRDSGPAGVDICLLSLADMLGTYGPTLPPELWGKLLDVVALLFEAWWEKPGESVSPPALLNGHELMDAFQLEAGPLIGQLLEAIREAQAAGEVASRQEALDLAQKVLAEIRNGE
jgi:tRNA nucleotidyltransferase/poly(A) polymerase